VAYLLDTDVLSNLARPRPSPLLLTKIYSTPGQEQFTSSITVGELIYGAYRLPRRTSALLDAIDSVILPRHVVLPFDEVAARRYGELRAELEQQGTLVGDADLRIAAIALSGGLTVVTGNTRHFEKIPGLRLENWLEG
jgi:tRNA(fMet)-specific endonuclease VapC